MSDVLVVDPEDPGVEELHDGRHRDEADQSQGFLLALIGQVLTLQQNGALLLVRIMILLRQLPYAIKTQLKAPKAPY